jgi:hypothetical protein
MASGFEKHRHISWSFFKNAAAPPPDLPVDTHPAVEILCVHGITPSNTKASRAGQQSLGGFIPKTFRRRDFISILRRLRLCGKLTGRLSDNWAKNKPVF